MGSLGIGGNYVIASGMDANIVKYKWTGMVQGTGMCVNS